MARPASADRHTTSAALKLDAKGQTGTTGDSFTAADGRGP